VAEIRYTESIDIEAPIERVYEYRLDFTNLPDYNPGVSNFRQVAGDRPGAGAEYLFDLVLIEGAPPMETPIRVLDARAPELVVFDTGPGYIARETCTFAPAGDGTRAEFAYVVTIPGEVDEATIKMVVDTGSAQARTELELMKKNLEG
jgi:uncharacterized protein YndB with AHSA1/START domain